jgi:hypothetical protein
MCLCALLCVVCCFSVLFAVYTCTSIFICGTSCLRSAGYFKTGTSIPLQPTRRVFHSTAIQPSSRVRTSSFKVIIIIRLFTPPPPLGDIQILFPGIGNFHSRAPSLTRGPRPFALSLSPQPPRLCLRRALRADKPRPHPHDSPRAHRTSA